MNLFLLRMCNDLFKLIEALEKKSKKDRARIAALEDRLLELSPPKQVLIGMSQISAANYAPLPIFVSANCDLSEFSDNVSLCSTFFVDSLKSLKQISEIKLRYISHCELILDSSTNTLFTGTLLLDETTGVLQMDDTDKNELKRAFDLAGVKLVHNDVSLL